MKKWFMAGLAALCLLALSGCAAGEKIDYDLVFVNDSDAKIVEVVVDFQDQGGGCRNADSCPLERGDSFGFEAGKYPRLLYTSPRPPDRQETRFAAFAWKKNTRF